MLVLEEEESLEVFEMRRRPLDDDGNDFEDDGFAFDDDEDEDDEDLDDEDLDDEDVMPILRPPVPSYIN